MIEAFRETDKAVIKSIMTRPDIFETIAEDGQKPEDYEPDLSTHCFLSMRTGKGEITGIWTFHPWNAITLQVHAQVLPEFRKLYSMETCKAALEWVHTNNPEYKKVVAIVPLCYKNVRDFALANDFQQEGVVRQSYLKNGLILDQWLLGITRDEIGEYLDE